MSFARDLIYSFVNRRGDEMARFGPPEPYYKMIEAGTGDDLHLHGLLNRVEEERAHDEAERLREKAAEFATSSSDLVAEAMTAATKAAADHIDPYEVKNGQLYRKSDGKHIVGLKPGERRKT